MDNPTIVATPETEAYDAAVTYESRMLAQLRAEVLGPAAALAIATFAAWVRAVVRTEDARSAYVEKAGLPVEPGPVNEEPLNPGALARTEVSVSPDGALKSADRARQRAANTARPANSDGEQDALARDLVDRDRGRVSGGDAIEEGVEPGVGNELDALSAPAVRELLSAPAVREAIDDLLAVVDRPGAALLRHASSPLSAVEGGQQGEQQGSVWSRHPDLNRGPADYEAHVLGLRQQLAEARAAERDARTGLKLNDELVIRLANKAALAAAELDATKVDLGNVRRWWEGQKSEHGYRVAERDEARALVSKLQDELSCERAATHETLAQAEDDRRELRAKLAEASEQRDILRREKEGVLETSAMRADRIDELERQNARLREHLAKQTERADAERDSATSMAKALVDNATTEPVAAALADARQGLAWILAHDREHVPHPVGAKCGQCAAWRQVKARVSWLERRSPAVSVFAPHMVGAAAEVEAAEDPTGDGAHDVWNAAGRPPQCLARAEWTCTRPHGHAGDHAAYDFTSLRARWPASAALLNGHQHVAAEVRDGD
jgi:hypothetical protein